MFLTANHPNPLSARLAEVEIGMVRTNISCRANNEGLVLKL